MIAQNEGSETFKEILLTDRILYLINFSVGYLPICILIIIIIFISHWEDKFFPDCFHDCHSLPSLTSTPLYLMSPFCPSSILFSSYYMLHPPIPFSCLITSLILLSLSILRSNLTFFLYLLTVEPRNALSIDLSSFSSDFVNFFYFALMAVIMGSLYSVRVKHTGKVHLTLATFLLNAFRPIIITTFYFISAAFS